MRSAPRSRFLSPAGACISLCWGALAAGAAHAQAPQAPDAPLNLRPSPMLAEELPANAPDAPTFVFGERISGQPEIKTIIEGSAELRRAGTSLKADRLEFEQASQLATGQGQVRVSSDGNVFTGPALQLELDTFEGFFSQPVYQLRSGANGRSERIDFLSEKRLMAHRATYTSCERDNEASWKPAWELRAQRFYFDFEAEVGEAYKPVVRFYDVPILGWGGSVTFPLSDKRKSGVLPPSYTLDTNNGFSLTVPYYLDIAPNRDATITPTLMTKRGLDVGTEFRYLDRQYQGTLRANLLPNDSLTGEQRWSYALLHNGRWSTGVEPLGTLGYSLNLNRVSDDDYWRDFPRFNKSPTQRLLPNDVLLSWARGPAAVNVRTLKWQTLQSPETITPPYDLLPQITARYGLSDVPVRGIGRLDWSVDTNFTRFEALRSLTSQTNADRLVARAQVSRSWLTSYSFVTPKLQLHATQYNFDEEWRGARSASRLVPTFSLDSGLVFERDTSFFGQGFIQTLEPRAFYVRTPYRDQSRLPNYDSAENSFNFASIYTENTFLGNDRIADADLLTLGVTSRLLEADTGAERVRVGVAQRIRFEDQQVTLSGAPPEVQAERLSDLLFGAGVNWSRRWASDITTQYNPKLGESRRTSVNARYTPSTYRLLTAAYRLQRPTSTLETRQIDLGWQWPINDLWGDRGQDLGPGQGQGGRRWYSVGRLNYSVTDNKMVDSVLGLEYDGCCWIGRVVLQRSTSGASTANTQIMFQLEFVGFSRIGNNPLAALKTNVPRYQMLRDQVSLPSRFSNYD